MNEDSVNSIVAGMHAMMPEGYMFRAHMFDSASNIYTLTFKTANGRYVNLMSKESILDLQSKLGPRLRLERKAEAIAVAIRRNNVNRNIEFEELVTMILTVILTVEMNAEYDMVSLRVHEGT